MLVVGLGVGGVMLHFFLNQNQLMQERTTELQNSAQQKADEYRKTQENYIKELGQ